MGTQTRADRWARHRRGADTTLPAPADPAEQDVTGAQVAAGITPVAALVREVLPQDRRRTASNPLEALRTGRPLVPWPPELDRRDG